MTKIVGAFLGVAMTIGVGVGINAFSKEARRVNAETTTDSITITYDGFDGNPAYSSGTEYTGTFSDSSSHNITVACKYVMANNGDMQTQASNANIYNKTALPGRLVSIELNQTGTARAFSAFGGSSQLFSSSENGTGKSPTGTSLGNVSAAAKMTWTPAEDTNYTFFAIHKGGNAGYVSSIIVTYETSGSSQQQEDGVTLSLNKEEMDLDLNGQQTGSLTALAVATGDANANLTASSDDESVAEISTDTPVSGTAFNVTAKSVGTAHITVASVWDPTKTATCTVNVTDTTPRYVNFKKVSSLASGQRVLITTTIDNDYYYLPSTSTGNKAPVATACNYNWQIEKIVNVDANMVFTVSGNAEGWVFKNAKGNYLSASDNNNGIRVGGDEGSFTVEETMYGFRMKAAGVSYNRYVGVYNKADWRSYNSATQDNYAWPSNNAKYNCDCIKFWVEALPEQTVTGPTSAYTDEEVTLTTTAENPTWSISDTYTTAEGASVTNDGVVSATGEGTVEVKISAEGYEDAFHSIYFSVRPADAYVTPNPSVINGFTGQSVNVTFTYGNIKTSFYAMSRNQHVCDVNDFDCDATSGSFRVDLVGAGSTTVKFYDGSVEIGSIAVTVEQSTVSFTGFPTLGQLAPGETQDMMKSIIVNTTGTCTDALSWESDNESVATVDANGVVTAVAEGQANITATSIDYPSTTATCTFTVLKSQFKLVDAFVDGRKYILAAEGKDDPSHILYLPAGTSEVDKNPVENGTFSTSWFTESMAWTANVNDSSQVVFSNDYEGTTYYLNAIDNSQGISIGTECTGYWFYDGTGLKFSASTERYLVCYNDFTFRNYKAPLGNDARMVNKFYEYIPTAKQVVESMNTQTSLAYRYEKDGEGNFTYSDIVMRFGGQVSKDLWNELDTDSHKITGFGVILMDGEAVKNMTDVADAMTYMALSTVSEDLNEYLAIDYFVPVESMNEKIGSDDNNYFWNLRVSVAQSEMNKAYAAVAYIKLGDEYVLLNMANESVETLALDYIVNRGCDETTAGGSLQNIIDKAA